MEPQGELQGRLLGNFELSELLPQGCDLDRSSELEGVIRLPVGVVQDCSTTKRPPSDRRFRGNFGGKGFFLGRQLEESPSFFNASKAPKKKRRQNTEGGDC